MHQALFIQRLFALAVLGLAWPAGCVPESGLEGRPCPCSTGFVCCDDVCTAEAKGCAEPPDAGVRDAAEPARRFVALAVGSYHNCAIRSRDHHAVCWGDPEYGKTSPPPFEFLEVSAGLDHTCGLRTDHSIACWGAGTTQGERPHYGQADPPDGHFSQVSAGTRHSCAVQTSDGRVRCWGDQDEHPLRPPDDSFAAISVGGSFACGLLTEGRQVWCFGLFSQPPAAATRQISSGDHHMCALLDDGDVTCFGSSACGETLVPANVDAAQVSAGYLNTCARSEAGVVRCWGAGAHGASSGDDFGQSDPPPHASAWLGVGAYHACSLDFEGDLVCWGNNSYDQIAPLPEP